VHAPLHSEHMSTFGSGERLCATAPPESTSKDAQFLKDAKGAHLDRVNTLGERLSGTEVLDL
jgi:hypothetical protein